MSEICVIVPVYKVEPYLHRCVDSIIDQTYKNFALVLTDDGSPDGCGEICDEYAMQDDRMIVFHQPNGGLSAARNTAIDYSFACSDSEWLTFIDSDDWVHPMYLDALYSGAKENDASIVISESYVTAGEDPPVDESGLCAKKYSTEDYYINNTTNAVIACGKLISKSDFSGIRYPFGKIHEDTFTTYKILFRYEYISVIHQPLYAYYKNSDGIMRANWSPRFLVIADALEEQIAYFDHHGFTKAYKYTISSLFGMMRHHIDIMGSMDGQYEKEYASYLKRFKNNLKKYRNDYRFNEHQSSYVLVYPVLKPVVFIKRLISELQKNGFANTVKKLINKVFR